MTQNDIIKVIAEILEINIDELNINTKREDIEKWDSLSHILIIGELEERLKIKIPFEDIAYIEKISDFFKYLKE